MRHQAFGTLLSRWFVGLLSGLALLAGCNFSNDPVDSLVRELSDSYSITREQAARKLGDMGPKAVKAIPALRKRLLDIHKGVRQTAAEALGKIGPAAKVAILDLSKRFFDKEPGVRLKAAWSLGRIGEPSLPELSKLLSSDYPHARYLAIQALMQIKGKGIQQLQKALKDPSRKVRRAAVEALLQLGHTHLSMILPLLKDSQPDIRSYVAWRMSRLAPKVRRLKPKKVPELVTALADALKDESYQVRMYASFALSKFDEEAAPALKGLIEATQDKEWYVRKNAINALGAMKQKALSAIPHLAKCLLDETWDVKNEAARSLRRIDEPKTVLAIIPLLKNPKPSIRKFVAQTLGWMGATSKPAVSSLIQLLNDAHPKVWMAAQVALRQIGTASVPELTKSLRTRNHRMKERVLDTLTLLGTKAASATKAIQSLTSSRVWFVQQAALYALGSVRPYSKEKVAQILATLSDKSKRGRNRAAKSMGGAGKQAGPSAIKFWKQALSSKGSFQKELFNSLSGLVLYAPASFTRSLMTHFGNLPSKSLKRRVAVSLVRNPAKVSEETETYVRQAIEVSDKTVHEALAAMLARLPKSKKKLYLLSETLKSRYPSALRTSLQSLLLEGPGLVSSMTETLAQAKVITPVLQLLNHRKSFIRALAAEVLGSLGTKSKIAIPQLIKALKDRKASVRMEAAAALGWIGKVANSAIPALKKATGDRDARVRRNAVFALSLMVKKAIKPLTKLLLSNHKPQHINNTCLAFQRIWIPSKQERDVKESLKILLLDKKLPKTTLALVQDTLRRLQSNEKKQVFWVDHPRSPTLEVYVPEILFPHGP